MAQNPNNSKTSADSGQSDVVGTLQLRVTPENFNFAESQSKTYSYRIAPLEKIALGICLMQKQARVKQQLFLNGLDLITLKSAKNAIDQISALSSYFVNHPIDGFMLSPDGNPDSLYADVARENLMSAEARIRELEEAHALATHLFQSLYDLFDGALVENSERFCKYENRTNRDTRIEKAHKLSTKSALRLIG